MQVIREYLDRYFGLIDIRQDLAFHLDPKSLFNLQRLMRETDQLAGEQKVYSTAICNKIRLQLLDDILCPLGFPSELIRFMIWTFVLDFDVDQALLDLYVQPTKCPLVSKSFPERFVKKVKKLTDQKASREKREKSHMYKHLMVNHKQIQPTNRLSKRNARY